MKASHLSLPSDPSQRGKEHLRSCILAGFDISRFIINGGILLITTIRDGVGEGLLMLCFSANAMSAKDGIPSTTSNHQGYCFSPLAT